MKKNQWKKDRTGCSPSDQRRGPGRPRIFEDPELLSSAQGLTDTRGLSRRQSINAVYAWKAFTQLAGRDRRMPEKYRYLWDRNTTSSWARKPTLLTELGRLGGVEKIRKVAEVVCLFKPTTTVAVVVIQAIRVGRKKLVSERLIKARIKLILGKKTLRGLQWSELGPFTDLLFAEI